MEVDSDIEILIPSPCVLTVSSPGDSRISAANDVESVIILDPSHKEESVETMRGHLTDVPVSDEAGKQSSSKAQADLYKQLSKFHREVRASVKSKCEQNLVCLVDSDVLEISGEVEKQLSETFKSRRIGDQLKFPNTTGMKVLWKRRILEAEVQEDNVVRKEQWVYENQCAFVIAGDSFALMSHGQSLSELFELLSNQVPFSAPRIAVAVYGSQRRGNNIADAVLEAYVHDNVQVRLLNSPEELARFIAQMHRSIAHKQSRMEKQNQVIVDGEKGIREADDLVKDWWMKMLKRMHRIGDNQCRAIVKEYPDPLALSETLLAIGARDGIKLISEVVTDTGGCVGPVIARKIFLMLTATTGREVMVAL